jgi:hypothetical protein
MQFDERTYVNAGVAFVLWARNQTALREWVREVEDDVIYHAPEALR